MPNAEVPNTNVSAADEVRDQRALRVVGEVEPTRPLPVVRLVRATDRAAPDQEGEPQPRQDGAGPRSTWHPMRRSDAGALMCGERSGPSVGSAGMPPAPGASTPMRPSASHAATARPCLGEDQEDGTDLAGVAPPRPEPLSEDRHPARQEAPGLGPVCPGRQVLLLPRGEIVDPGAHDVPVVALVVLALPRVDGDAVLANEGRGDVVLGCPRSPRPGGGPSRGSCAPT